MDIFNLQWKELHQLAEQKKQEYKSAFPYPHICLDGLFKPEILHSILKEFPDLAALKQIQFDNPYEKKLATSGEYIFGNELRLFMHILNSQPFLEFLEKLTGIDNLIPDPDFLGGGCHEIKPGGYLKIHADFNKHQRTGLDRRLNVLVYLNENWQESYGGHFELWDKQMQKAEKKILPLFNRMVVFSTTSDSFHGHPEPLNCPPDRSRRSLALYYYTNGRPESEYYKNDRVHSTLFRARPGSKDAEGIQMRAINSEKINYLAKEWFFPPGFWKLLKKIKS
jgi:Rps23 Pro-64 3,4-dihydroxylase Tpa1-like proline 4-hydroxylase